MAEDEAGERTEQATPRKRQQAREKGNVPRSKDLTGIIPLWIFFLYLSYGGFIFTTMLTYLQNSLRRSFEMPVTMLSFGVVLKSDGMQFGYMMAPLFGSMVVVIIAVHFLQTGFLISTSSLSPDLSKLNPLEGVKKYFNLNTLFETVKGAVKLVILSFILYMILKKQIVTLPQLVDMDVQSIMMFSLAQIKKLILISAIVLSFFAIVDYVYQKWQYERNMRMSKQEIKEEMKQIEGDPRVKARIKSLQRDMARKRMMQEVPKADVVITNPTHYAVALKYDSAKMGAPTIVAKGSNLIAEKIKEIAAESRVPMFEDKPLARILFKLNIGQEVPADLYKAVASILANVYKMKGKVGSAK